MVVLFDHVVALSDPCGFKLSDLVALLSETCVLLSDLCGFVA